MGRIRLVLAVALTMVALTLPASPAVAENWWDDGDRDKRSDHRDWNRGDWDDDRDWNPWWGHGNKFCHWQPIWWWFPGWGWAIVGWTNPCWW